MGLSYLSKKSWHPSTFKNIEQVWAAEQKKRDEEKHMQERIKKLKEEKQIEELKQMQYQANIIDQSSLKRIEWMYQDRAAQQGQNSINAQSSEDYLLGKSVKDLTSKDDGQSKGERDFKKIVPVIRGDTFTTPENEAFVKMMEDPLVYIKQKEIEARHAVIDNPLKMKQIREEIEALKEGKKHKKKSKKDKKKKKHKKDKKKKSKKNKERSRNRSRSSSSSESRSRSSAQVRSHRDSSSESEQDRTKDRSHKSKYSSNVSEKSSRHKSNRSRSRSEERHHHRSSRREDYSRKHYDRHRDSRSNSRDKSPQEKIKSSLPTEKTRDLGPDMSLYGEKLRILQENEKLRKKQQPSTSYEQLTEEERLLKVREMQDYARRLDEQRNSKLFGSREIPREDRKEGRTVEDQKEARFLQQVNRNAFMESDMGLEESIGRRQHYIERGANRE